MVKLIDTVLWWKAGQVGAGGKERGPKEVGPRRIGGQVHAYKSLKQILYVHLSVVKSVQDGCCIRKWSANVLLWHEAMHMLPPKHNLNAEIGKVNIASL